MAVEMNDVKIGGTAPSSEVMERVLGPYDSISVQQTMRGCFQEMCGCEAQSEYKVYGGHVEDQSSRDENVPQLGHLLEESGFFMRCCCADKRAFDMPFTEGEPQGEGSDKKYGQQVLRFRKPCSLPICCVIRGQDGDCLIPCCCCLPQVNTHDGTTDEFLGSSHYKCDMCLFIPKFIVKDKDGNDQYLIKPETCCGCCLACKMGKKSAGAGSLYMPFYIRDPETEEILESNATFNGENKAQIKKVWSGFKKECCSDADNFQVTFPKDASTATKANLLGATVLVDFSWFETQS